MTTFAIAGAGFSGAVLARQLAEAGHRCTVFDSRPHVAGNCYTERDDETQVMVHTYGPHIFHTANERVWEYINRFGDLVPYDHHVNTTVGDEIFALPINLLTINQLFGTNFDTQQAEEFVDGLGDHSISDPQNFEEQALRFVGRRMYEAFFYGYTRKQWGVEPAELPASILKRLPVRFDTNQSYFNHPHQAIPRHGYTPIVEAILNHPGITVHLSTPLTEARRAGFDHTIWTGPLDAYFEHGHGRLGYRTLDFEASRSHGDAQGIAVMNYGDLDVPYTRVSEHKHFAPWESHERTITFKEYSRYCEPDDTPYYPIRLNDDHALLDTYLDAAEQAANVTFAGRLGTYRYLDMDVTIAEALDTADAMLACIDANQVIPSFFIDPR